MKARTWFYAQGQRAWSLGVPYSLFSAVTKRQPLMWVRSAMLDGYLDMGRGD